MSGQLSVRSRRPSSTAERFPHKEGVPGSTPGVATGRRKPGETGCVVVPHVAQFRCGVGEFGRPRWAHNPEIVGSNPSAATKATRICDPLGHHRRVAAFFWGISDRGSAHRPGRPEGRVRPPHAPRRSWGRSSVAEHLLCKQTREGSSPFASTGFLGSQAQPAGGVPADASQGCAGNKSEAILAVAA